MGLPVDAVGVGEDTLAAWAAQVKAAIDDLYVVVTDSTIGTVAAGFTVNSGGQIARTAVGGKLVHINLYLNSTNAITVTAGNTGDTLMFTVEAAYRPSEIVSGVCATGLATGEAILDTTGGVTLRSMSDPIAAGANLRIAFTFLVA
jgi:hypothetical protein